MSDWLDVFANSGVPGVPGVPNSNFKHLVGFRGVPAGVPGVLHNTPEHQENRSKLLKNREEHPEHHKRANPSALLRDWHRHLSALDERQPPAHFDPARWWQMVEDACWVYENFAGQAVRDGWSALDLFGVLPFDVTLGGLVPRLAGARNLKMDRDRAIWSNWGVRDWTCRGTGDGLMTSGIVPLWGMQKT